MRRILFALSILAVPALVFAQAAPPAIPGVSPAPLPRGPLLAKAPAFSKWLISSKANPDDSVQPPDQATKYDHRELVEKTGDVRYQIDVDVSGAKSEKWCVGALQAMVRPGEQPTVSMYCADTPNNPNFTDYSKSDFQGFGWITKHNYIGIAIMEGVQCLVFHTGGDSDAAAPAPASPTTTGSSAAAPTDGGNTAFIDVKSRLPVLLVANGTTDFYQFEPPPTAQLTPPPNVQAALSQTQNNIQQASAQGPPP